MTAFLLKLIAIITMTIDHIGLFFFPEHVIFRIIGRISFPIFCFLLAEGFANTRNKRAYTMRMLAFAFISEIPYQLFIYRNLHAFIWRQHNVFFELFTALLALFALRKAVHCFRRLHGLQKSNQGSLGWLSQSHFYWGLFCIALSVLFAAAAEALQFSYGAYGIFLVLFAYLFREQRLIILIIPSFALLTGLYCLDKQISLQFFAILATIPIVFYRGKKGKSLPKYWFYVYYPAHLLLIYCLGFLLPLR